MSEYLVFDSRDHVDRETGDHITIAVPHELPTEVDPNVDVLRIDGEDAEVDPQVVQALVGALHTVREMAETRSPIRMDCMGFGVLLSGGKLSAAAYQENLFPYRQTNFYREVVTIAEAAEIPRVLEPAILGNIVDIDGDEMLGPEHMVVGLNPETDLYIQKFGYNYIGITGLAAAATCYRSDTVGSVLSTRVRNANHKALFSYKAPDEAKTLPAPIATMVHIRTPFTGQLHKF
jgi:hypothetical protein